MELIAKKRLFYRKWREPGDRFDAPDSAAKAFFVLRKAEPAPPLYVAPKPPPAPARRSASAPVVASPSPAFSWSPPATAQTAEVKAEDVEDETTKRPRRRYLRRDLQGED